jgi:hypothetical protein
MEAIMVETRAYRSLEKAFEQFTAAGETEAAQKVSDLYRDISGGHGGWCKCGRMKWRYE